MAPAARSAAAFTLGAKRILLCEPFVKLDPLEVGDRHSDSVNEMHTLSGLVGALEEVFDKAVLRPVRLRFVRVLVLEANDVESLPAVDPSVGFRLLRSDEVAGFATDGTNNIGPHFAWRARGGLDLCFGAVFEGRLASYAWCALGSVEAEHAAGSDLELPGDTAYLYKGFTHPDFRGRQLYPACMSAALEALRPRGIERLVAFVHWTDDSARRSCARLGYRDLGVMPIGPRGPIRVPARARALGVRFGTDARVATRS